MSEHEVVADSPAPATADSLLGQLTKLPLPDDATVLVHSSLSHLGWVAGGAQAAVDALVRWVGPSGTLVMPTHGGMSEPSLWRNPAVPESWWPVIRDHAPAFDPRQTPTRMMGAIVDCFRSREQSLRSDHPALSFAASGPAARAIVGSHSLDDGLGESSPLARIEALNGFVLLLGVGHANNTSLHLAEHRARCGGKRWVTQGSAVMVDGRRRWITYRDLDYDSHDFEALGADFSSTGGETSSTVGTGEAKLMRQRALLDFAQTWFEQNRPAQS
ncbi:MAG: aminoglycoside 3-N-acetyltransferase [Chloroflexota bacterium]|jgi:aminoglycoside 3-N-acetyltransferase|nr:aminoglycoside 3-N-acetyltransferase [Chloroflexota bacterium]